MSIASSFELETEILLACDLNFLEESKVVQVLERIQEIQKMMFGFKEKISVK